jgi:hypothetical protein
VKLRAGLNTIAVVFQSALNTGRYMACTGGWDWAPYSNTKTATGVMGDGSNDTTTEPTFTKVAMSHKVIHAPPCIFP